MSDESSRYPNPEAICESCSAIFDEERVPPTIDLNFAKLCWACYSIAIQERLLEAKSEKEQRLIHDKEAAKARREPRKKALLELIVKQTSARVEAKVEPAAKVRIERADAIWDRATVFDRISRWLRGIVNRREIWRALYSDGYVDGAELAMEIAGEKGLRYGIEMEEEWNEGNPTIARAKGEAERSCPGCGHDLRVFHVAGVASGEYSVSCLYEDCECIDFEQD